MMKDVERVAERLKDVLDSAEVDALKRGLTVRVQIIRKHKGGWERTSQDCRSFNAAINFIKEAQKKVR